MAVIIIPRLFRELYEINAHKALSVMPEKKVLNNEYLFPFMLFQTTNLLWSKIPSALLFYTYFFL